ncbi:MAG: hypothetical protein JKY94_13820 [Rhodobacteraceae bacterium]|nr:hypothetical protein [Paracoccaceae bacterium]
MEVRKSKTVRFAFEGQDFEALAGLTIREVTSGYRLVIPRYWELVDGIGVSIARLFKLGRGYMPLQSDSQFAMS